MTEYFVPEKHIQLKEIANTPLWLREHFSNEGKLSILNEIDTEITKLTLKYPNNYGSFLDGIDLLISKLKSEVLK